MYLTPPPRARKGDFGCSTKSNGVFLEEHNIICLFQETPTNNIWFIPVGMGSEPNFRKPVSTGKSCLAQESLA